MSFVIAEPELVTAAAERLSGIGSNLGEATAAAAAPTTGFAAAASDEVSIAVSEVFGRFGREFQALGARAVAFQDEFVSLLNGGAAAYLGAEIANAEHSLLSTGLSTGAAASGLAAAPGGAYGQLIVNTSANLQNLFNTWSADPFPFLRQVLVNQIGYWQQIATALTNTIENFPAFLASLPAAIQAGIQQLLTFPAASYVQQFITTQIGFAQEFFTYLNAATTGIWAGLPAFANGLQVAWQAVRAGDYFGAVQDVAQAFANLMVTGVDPSTPAVSQSGGSIIPPVLPTVTATVNPTLLGPLGDLFAMANIPGQEAQYLTNLMPPSILRQMSQNLTNALNVLTIPSISATTILPLSNPTTGSLSAFFGLPLQLTYAAAGAPLAALEGLATSATAVQQALLAGNPVGAFGALVAAPAVVANGFLNGETIVDMTIPVPVYYSLNPLLPPVSFTMTIVLHLPFDGILVPPHPLTGTVALSSPISTDPYPVTIFGTPFMGLAPLLLNYLPQELAGVIAPTG
ncbi:PE family protein [Mycobacterium interjectum]|uniref:PE family protein n=1 Tax=Mycobacterium interjectum TaxID=33895 RepID=UPI0021F3AC04|nr:PE family protein [Mycobacterium interjectum]MCV7092803.1 PE family protein [Mycobacterium interjectum]